MSDTSEQTENTQGSIDPNFRPLTRAEQRSLWLRAYGEQDIALQSWVRLVEQGLEIEMMFQMRGLLVFGTLVSTATYARFYINLNEEMYRQQEPETADFLLEYYTALVPAADQPEIGTEGLPNIYRSVHLRDVTILSAGHQVKVPYWRGRLSEVEAFVVGASPTQPIENQKA